MTGRAIMRSIFTNLILFVALAFAFSTLTGCPAPTAVNSKAEAPNTATKATSTQTKSSEYPPVPAAIAQADIELLDGSMFKIGDRKGKILLLNLWATWCGPCRAEIPELVVMQELYKDKGFQVLGLDVGDGDGGQETVEEITIFAQKFKINYELARLSNETSAAFYKFSQFSGVPITILVDRENRIRALFKGGGPRVIGEMKVAVEKLVNES